MAHHDDSDGIEDALAGQAQMLAAAAMQTLRLIERQREERRRRVSEPAGHGRADLGEARRSRVSDQRGCARVLLPVPSRRRFAPPSHLSGVRHSTRASQFT